MQFTLCYIVLFHIKAVRYAIYRLTIFVNMILNFVKKYS